MELRVRAGMQLQLQVTTCLLTACTVCDSTMLVSHVLASMQVLEVSYRDFCRGAYRPLEYSMVTYLKWSVSDSTEISVAHFQNTCIRVVTPLAIYPPTWRGVLAALHYRNWLIIIFCANRQQGDRLPSK